MLALIGFLLIAEPFGRLARADEVQCWAPNGKTLADNETVVPCNKLGIQQEGVYSSCCRLDGDANQRDYCTTSGLCLSTFDGVLRREYCTDKTWKSPACNGGSFNGTIDMTACSDGTGTYCCGRNELGCCGTDHAIVIPTQASVVSSGDTTAAADSSSSNSFKSATIGLAVVLGVLFVATAGTVSWLLYKNKLVKKKLLEKTEAEEARHVPSPLVVHPYSSPYDPGTPPSQGFVRARIPKCGVWNAHQHTPLFRARCKHSSIPQRDGFTDTPSV
ncbi:hypothetical protein CIB48_g3094 [Xylaria polymorpha]|nr:hypothetical protein CIB48_g3094 [Xylaria polymorpha]